MRRLKLQAALLSLFFLVGCSTAPMEALNAFPTESTAAKPTEIPDATIGEVAVTETFPEETAKNAISETVPEEIFPIPQEARRIEDGFLVLLNRADISGPMGDGSVYSKNTIYTHQQLLLKSEVPFSSLYLVWDTLPGSYTITYDGGSLSCGKNNFSHEYIALPEPTTQVEFVFDQGTQPRLCDVFAYTEGTPPSDVQIWQPPCKEADILVFPTHADDDALFFGGLIAYYSIQQELTVQVAFMVRHVTETPERNHERLNGLWEMGVRHYPILGTAPDTAVYDFQDAMAYYASSNIQQWQVAQIRRFKPLVILGHDLNGEYGNGGHKVNAHFLIQAVHMAKDPSQFSATAEKYGTWETPKLYLHLYEENAWVFDVDTPITRDPLFRSPREIAEQAVQAHVSQQKGIRYLRNLPGSEKYMDCNHFGLYHSLVGPDAKADVMEHIHVAYWRSKAQATKHLSIVSPQ